MAKIKMQSYILKLKNISLNLISVILMIGLIPQIKSDYWLALIYALIIVISWSIKYEKKGTGLFAVWIFWNDAFRILFHQYRCGNVQSQQPFGASADLVAAFMGIQLHGHEKSN